MANELTAPTYATLDEVFERFHYPAGESHIRLQLDIDISELAVIEATARNFADIAQIVTADRILKRNDVSVRWFLPYFPFARHDRRNDAGDGFELQLAIEMVAELDIVIADPHSEVAGQLLHIDQADAVATFRDAGIFDDDPIVVIPDAGAAKKAYDWIDGATVVQASKRRDPRTGQLSGFAIPEQDLGGRPCIIVDDICDGGGTFLGLAEQLRTVHNAGPLTLVVTHGLFTKGLDALTAVFDRIYTFAPTNEAPTTPDTNGVIRLPFHMLYEKGTRR